MDLTDFLALPGNHYLRLKVGPGLYDTIDVDRVVLDSRSEQLLQWAKGLGAADGASWRDLTQHTGGNSALAKLLVALGEVVGAWRMVPDGGEGLWTQYSPRVRLLQPRARTKPSEGSADPVGSCECCGRPYGPRGSIHHNLRRSDVSDLCEECASYGCAGEGRCLATDPPPPPAPRRVVAKEERAEYVPERPTGIDAYLRSLN